MNRHGRRQFLAGITAVGVTAGLAGCLGDDDESVPEASFSLEPAYDDAELTVTHESGETFDEENTAALQILEPGEDGDTQFGEFEPPVREGDELLVDGFFEPGQTLTVRWISPDGEEYSDVESVELE